MKLNKFDKSVKEIEKKMMDIHKIEDQFTAKQIQILEHIGEAFLVLAHIKKRD